MGLRSDVASDFRYNHFLKAQTVKTLGPDVTLEGCKLQDALESIYSEFAAVLRGRGETDAPYLYTSDIPGMVFDVAVGAGWMPLAETSTPIGTGADPVWQADFQITDKTDLPQWVRDLIEDEKRKGWQPPAPTKLSKNQAQRLVHLGEFVVERSFANSFYALLKDTVAFHLGEGTKHEENLKRLPKSTSKKQREAFLQQYIAKERAQGIRTPMKKVAKDAGVQYTVLVAWKNKRAPVKPDSSDAAKRILLLLLFGEHGKARHYRRAEA